MDQGRLWRPTINVPEPGHIIKSKQMQNCFSLYLSLFCRCFGLSFKLTFWKTKKLSLGFGNKNCLRLFNLLEQRLWMFKVHLASGALKCPLHLWRLPDAQQTAAIGNSNREHQFNRVQLEFNRAQPEFKRAQTEFNRAQLEFNRAQSEFNQSWTRVQQSSTRAQQSSTRAQP